jgi:hypothetical protein
MNKNHAYHFVSNEDYETSCERCGRKRTEHNSYGVICYECKDFMKKESIMILQSQPERSKRENSHV